MVSLGLRVGYGKRGGNRPPKLAICASETARGSMSRGARPLARWRRVTDPRSADGRLWGAGTASRAWERSAVPGNAGAEPVFGDAVPMFLGGEPGFRAIVPGFHGNGPGFGVTVPGSAAAVPGHRGTVPRSARVGPGCAGAVARSAPAGHGNGAAEGRPDGGVRKNGRTGPGTMRKAGGTARLRPKGAARKPAHGWNQRDALPAIGCLFGSTALRLPFTPNACTRNHGNRSRNLLLCGAVSVCPYGLESRC